MTEEFDEEPQVVVFIAIKSWCCHSSLACNPMLFAAKVLLTSDALDEIHKVATGIAMFPPFLGYFYPFNSWEPWEPSSTQGYKF